MRQSEKISKLFGLTNDETLIAIIYQLAQMGPREFLALL
jgi:hypothetical protein